MNRRRLRGLAISVVAAALIALTLSALAADGSSPGAVKVLCWYPHYTHPPEVTVYSKVRGAKAIAVIWHGRRMKAEHSGNVWAAYFPVRRSGFQEAKRHGTIGTVRLGAVLRSGRHVHRRGEARTCTFA